MQIACAVAGSVPKFLIGYNPKKIHNVAEPPPVNEEDLPSCPVLK